MSLLQKAGFRTLDRGILMLEREKAAYVTVEKNQGMGKSWDVNTWAKTDLSYTRWSLSLHPLVSRSPV